MHNAKNGWVVKAKYVAICEEGNSGSVWYLVVSRSIMFEICLLRNVHKFTYFPFIAEENAQQPSPFLRTFLFTKYTQEGA